MPDHSFALNLNSPYLLLLLGVILVTALLTWLATYLYSQKKITTLSTTLELERKAAAKHLKDMENTFAALSSEALKNNNQSFLMLAQETMKQFHGQAKSDLESKEKAVENLVKPIKEALEKTEHQIHKIEQDRREAYGALTKHLETMALSQQQLQSETRNLVQALRRPEVRGQWGEITLRRLVELAGMVEHCDFYEQEHTQSEDGPLRPDMVIRMPAGREVIVDIKTPLDAYLSAVEADSDQLRQEHLQRHARNVRNRIRELAGKAYWSQFKQTPDFVVLFIPGDQFLGAALDVDHSLLENALQQKVILATPSSFVALLRAVAFGWRQETLAENAEKIRTVGEALFHRLATFAEHLSKLGRSLDSSVSHFNKAVGSFDTGVLPGARKFTEMGLNERKPLAPLDQIEKASRKVGNSSGKK
ncbi:MAG TPA: DNA recombination protein RmuC [Acidiferrobacteraceae bacterium]|mgnify:CR=1 FL=1|nr:DNA recombination protein RmuC [Acidiferrobacteraceae bacterium]